MKALLLSLLLLPLHAQAQEAPAGGLKCEIDANDAKDPYGRMKKRNEQNIRDGIRRMGVTLSVARLPRQDMVTGLNKHLGDLCTMKNLVETSASNITNLKSEAEAAEAGPQGCEKYQGLNTKIGSFNTNNKAYQKALADSLSEQRNRYQKLIVEDHKILQPHIGKPAVNQAFRSAWGSMVGDERNEKTFKEGLISNRLIQIEDEQKLNGSRQEGYDALTKSIDGLKSKCPSLIDPMKASAQRKDDAYLWDGSIKKGEDPSISDPNATDPNAVDTNATDPNATDPNAADLNDPNRTPHYVPTNTENAGAVVEGPAPKQEGWISRNKGPILIGVGAAAVVGGALWYKHEQDKKTDETNEWINNQVHSATATATTTSTGTSTNPDANTLSVSGFPPSAVVNYVVPKISVTVSGPNKDNAQVSIACVNSCSLAGTLTKTATGGKAEFTDLYFTAPHDGVQLRVSAPGMNSIASPGSFNVFESGRQ